MVLQDNLRFFTAKCLTSTPAKSPLRPLDATICLVVSTIPWGISLVCIVDLTTSGAMDTIQPI